MNPPKDLPHLAVSAETADVPKRVGVAATEVDPPPARIEAPEIPEVPEAPTRLGYRIAKRTLDLTASSIGLVVLSPLFAGIAAAVRLDSPGPILIRQERVGLGGRPFACFKFRTMHVSSDESAHRRHVSRLIRENEADEATWLPIEQDARVRRLGAILRRSHLDELPQLIHIIRGDMSLVGPRPAIPYEVELYQPWHLRRMAVKPGLTGLWQVSAWGKLSFDEGVKLDLDYIERRSLGLDITIVLRTIWQIVTRRQF
jgi:lipopolysaccharide/colanic/teichoic acid biosynthesis glycosyltransferase